MQRSMTLMCAPTCALLCAAMALCGCGPTVSFVPKQPMAVAMHPHPTADVDLFFADPPARPYVDAGAFAAPESGAKPDVHATRLAAARAGCDALWVPTARCLVYTDAATASAAAANAPAAPAPSAAAGNAPAPGGDASACQKGQATACIRAGIAALEAKSADGGVKALEFFQKACDAKNNRGCTHLGILLVEGAPGVPKKESAAFEHFVHACAVSDPIACRYLGMMHLQGQGVPKTVKSGVEYLGRACEEKDSWSCWRLARLYKGSEGVSRESEKVASYYRKACSLGYQKACQELK